MLIRTTQDVASRLLAASGIIRRSQTYGPSYFDAKYAANGDPWNYQTSDYEAAKYRTTLAALGARRFSFGFEAGCSIGVLTQQLAGRCDRLAAVDYSRLAVEAATARCAGLPGVSIAFGAIPDWWPTQRPDLIVLSEVLYYLSRRQLAEVSRRIAATLARDGMVVSVHWLGPLDVGLSGNHAADLMLGGLGPGWRTLTERRGPLPGYRIDVTTRLG